ncbi:hypothetical protein [Acinetobacter indicus]|uniref:hypothetical protein n=1 Tax=Acinetobacter indicus TaxID=756892 RepID=UPI0025750666|nr:hypothetical protein [Acinetobacter indicus]MDM1328918.1 hypothetical protein [Acinetobacter indicus]
MHYPQWLNDFFQFNKIDLDRIITQQYPEPKKTLFNNFLFPFQQQKKYFALPYVDQDKTVHIYLGGAYETRELIELEGIAKNALGSSYIANYEILYDASDDHHATKVLLQNFPSGVIRLTYYSTVSGDEISTGFHLIQRLIRVINNRPYLTQKTRRPVGRILREFNLAKEEGDIETVLTCFEEIKNSASLGAKNLMFLEIQTLAIAGKWSEIRKHTQLKHLIESLMPIYLVQNILDALGQLGADQLLNKPLEVTIDIKTLQKEYEKFKPLFTRFLELPENHKYKRQWQQWVIGCCLLGQYQYFEQLPKFIDMKWCGEVKQIINNHGSFIQLREGKHYGLTLTVPQSLDQTRIYLNYCLSLSPEYWQDIWIYLEKISLEIRSYLNQDLNLKEKWEKIECYCSKKITYEWNNWFEQLLEEKDINPEEFLLKLHNESQIWSPKSFNESQLIKVIQSNENKLKEILRDALPSLIKWLNENQYSLKNETILILFTLIVDDEKSDPNDLKIFYDLLIYWSKQRDNYTFDAQIIMSLDLILKKCSLNPLYDLPVYQQRVQQIFDVLNSIKDIQKVDVQLLNDYVRI